MPVKAVKRLLPEDNDQNSYFQICDVVLILVLVVIIGTLVKGVHHQVSEQ